MSYENVPKNLTEKAVLVRGGRPDYSKLAAAAFPVPTADEAGAILEDTDTGDRFRWSGTAWYQTEDAGKDKVLADIVGTVPVDVTSSITLPVDVASSITLPVDIVSSITLPVSITSTDPINVQTEIAKSAYNEVKVEESTPLTQISAKYGLLDLTLTVTDTAGSGSNSVEDNKFKCQTGTSSSGLASVLTLRQVGGRAGQGIAARFDAKFDTAVASSLQAAGLITTENSYVFGYIGTAFGIIYAHGGKSESQELTLTTPAGGSESATVTVDGIGYTVPLTSGTLQDNAFEVAVSLSAQVPNYNFTSNDDQVIAQALIANPHSTFAFTSATAAGAWVQTVAGLAAALDFIAQASWNKDTRLTGSAPRILDPTKGNWYQIQICSSFGKVSFFLEDSDTGLPTLVHEIYAANTKDNPNTTNPTYRLGWFVQNIGNTTNLTCGGTEAGAFVEGKVRRSALPRADNNDQLSVGTSLTNIITFRNRIHFGGKINRAEIIPLLITLSTQTNKSAFFEVVADPVFAAPLDFSYVDKQNSIMEVATDAVGVSGGRLLGTYTVVDGNAQTLEFNAGDDIDFITTPGSVFTVAARVSSGASSDMQATSQWVEDI